MDYQFLLVQYDESVATVTINRESALNALNKELLEELNLCFRELENDDVDVVILTGAGRSFVAGADIGEMAPLSAVEGAAWGKKGMAVFRQIENLSKPVIAAVNGFALGGGCEISMACDIRIASTKAKFGQPEVGLGITPDSAERNALHASSAKAKRNSSSSPRKSSTPTKRIASDLSMNSQNRMRSWKKP